MAIVLSSIEEWEEWIPPGERALFERDPDGATAMDLKFMTKERREHYERLAKRYKGQGMVSSADKKATRQLFDDHVRDIRNLSVGGVEIIDGGQFYDVDGLDVLQLQVIQALMERSTLEEGLAKKLRQASASSLSPLKASGDGDAADATQVSPTITQEEPPKWVISESGTQLNEPSVAVIGKLTP